MTPLLTTQAASELLGIDRRTLERYRVTGAGPKFVKMQQVVRYRVEDLQAWLASRTVSSTSESTRKSARRIEAEGDVA
jgi:predicted DNA-binding transcriptional regulator AlpA